MKVYIDSEFKCHTINQDGAFREVEIDFFDNKCNIFTEGFCYNDSKGYVQIYAWKPYSELDNAQREYEKQKLENCLEALQELGVEV